MPDLTCPRCGLPLGISLRGDRVCGYCLTRPRQEILDKFIEETNRKFGLRRRGAGSTAGTGSKTPATPAKE